MIVNMRYRLINLCDLKSLKGTPTCFIFNLEKNRLGIKWLNISVVANSTSSWWSLFVSNLTWSSIGYNSSLRQDEFLIVNWWNILQNFEIVFKINIQLPLSDKNAQSMSLWFDLFYSSPYEDLYNNIILYQHISWIGYP